MDHLPLLRLISKNIITYAQKHKSNFHCTHTQIQVIPYTLYVPCTFKKLYSPRNLIGMASALFGYLLAFWLYQYINIIIIICCERNFLSFILLSFKQKNFYFGWFNWVYTTLTNIFGIKCHLMRWQSDVEKWLCFDCFKRNLLSGLRNR